MTKRQGSGLSWMFAGIYATILGTNGDGSAGHLLLMVMGTAALIVGHVLVMKDVATVKVDEVPLPDPPSS